MKANQPLISYYPADDSRFLDPMYVPYKNRLEEIPGPTPKSCFTPVNTWPKVMCPEQVYPSHLRKEWYMDFLRIHPNDPCPATWHDAGNGMCTRSYTSGSESNFYTADNFAANPQFLDSYIVNHNDTDSMNKLSKLEKAPEFSKRSVNPHTGNYVEYDGAKPNRSSTRYGYNPARFSYLGK